MNLRSLRPLACMLLFSIGCGKTNEKNNDVVSTRAIGIPQITVKSSGTKLLDPGTEPRRALRFKFEANRTEKMVIETHMAMSIEVDGRTQPKTWLPVTEVTMTIESKEVSPEGNLHYEFKVEKTKVLPNSRVSPAVMKAAKQANDSLIGMSGSATVTPIGFTKDVKLKYPPGLLPQIRQMMDGMKESMSRMSTPFPEEPVGTGARWQTTTQLEINGIKITQIATYTVSELKSDGVTLDVTIKQSATRQDIATPNGKVSLESLSSTGKGTIEQLMANLVPTSHMSFAVTSVISAQNQRIKTTMKMEMKVHQ